MSLTIKHLNGDASFLLTFQPLEQFPSLPDASSNAFTIVLDPWLDGESKIWHEKFSVSTFKDPSHIRTLAELAEPDLVVVSQDKTDHCHERTLKTLPASGGKTTVLAEPAASKTIRSWKYFEANKIQTLRKWEDKKPETIHRICLKPLEEGGLSGEVTVSFITPKVDITGVHSAVCITYRPPTYASETRLDMPLTPPASPGTKPIVKSTYVTPRTLSVLFSPHGLPYSALQPFVISHLVSSAALPLTALLHCFDRVSNPWYMGGNICSGLPGGAEIAQNLLTRVWISAHDGDKDTSGFATLQTTITKFEREKVEEIVSPKSAQFPSRMATEVAVLKAGEEMFIGPRCR